MQFATSVIALFASLAVAVPVLPNRPTVDNQFGAWLVNFSHDSNAREYLSSSFYPADFDPNHDNPSRNACVADPNATPAFEKRCDHLGFTYEFDVETGVLSLQMVQGDVTLFGESTLDADGDAVIQVSKAIA